MGTENYLSAENPAFHAEDKATIGQSNSHEDALRTAKVLREILIRNKIRKLSFLYFLEDFDILENI